MSSVDRQKTVDRKRFLSYSFFKYGGSIIRKPLPRKFIRPLVCQDDESFIGLEPYIDARARRIILRRSVKIDRCKDVLKEKPYTIYKLSPPNLFLLFLFGM